MPKKVDKSLEIAVNGSTDGFDRFQIGVAGFDNPLCDSNTSAGIQALGKNWSVFNIRNF